MIEKNVYEVLEIIPEISDNCIGYEDITSLFSFETKAKNFKRAFINALKENGIQTPDPRNLFINCDFPYYELCEKETGVPLYCAILNGGL